MIILMNKDCQMSNRLLLAAHCIASGIEYNQDVFLATFGDMAEKYECCLDTNSISVRVGNENEILGKMLRKFRNYMRVYKPSKVREYSYNLPQINLKIKKNANKNHYIFNWYYRNYDALIKHQEEIRSYFKLKDSFGQDAERLYKSLRTRADCLVAVHIRHGDYATWNQGKFFYSVEQYLQWMEQLKVSLNKKGLSPHFIIFSNAVITDDIIKRDDITISTLSAVGDQYLMGKCNYIMGPPSTFSWWAAFIGNKEYCVLKNENQIVGVESFSLEFQPEYSIVNIGEIL